MKLNNIKVLLQMFPDNYGYDYGGGVGYGHGYSSGSGNGYSSGNGMEVLEE